MLPTPCPGSLGSIDEKHRHTCCSISTCPNGSIAGHFSSAVVIVPFPILLVPHPKSALSFCCSVTFSPSSASHPPAWRSGLWSIPPRCHMAGWSFSLWSMGELSFPLSATCLWGVGGGVVGRGQKCRLFLYSSHPTIGLWHLYW